MKTTHTKTDQHVVICVRLPRLLVEQADEYVKKLYPHVRNRTQLFEIALCEYLATHHPEASVSPSQ